MKALRLEEFGTMRVVEVPDPELPAGHVLLDIIATGICGSDIHGFTGANGRRHPGQIMGHESVGRIAARGAGVAETDFPTGAVATFNPLVVPPASRSAFDGREQHAPDRRVIGVDPAWTAAFAERLAVPAENVVLLPTDGVPAEWGALVEPLAVAVHAVSRAGVASGDAVLVLGGGPIGQSVALAARRAGADEVIVSEPDPSRRVLCATLGAAAIDPGDGAVSEQVSGRFGRPADVAIDAVGVSGTLADALASTTLGGRVGLVGMGAQRLEIDAYSVSTAERTIVGSFTYSSAAFVEAARWVGTGDPVLGSLISAIVPLEEGPEAFTRLARPGAAAGKVLVRFGS